MSAFRRLLSASAKLLAGQWCNTAILFIEGILLARALGAGGLGNWAVVQAIFSTLAALLGFRTSEALTRHLVRAREASQSHQQSRLLAAALSIDGAAAVLVSVVGISICLLFGERFLEAQQVPPAVFWIFAVTILGRSPANTWISLMRMERQFWHLALLQAVHSAGRLTALLALWLTDTLNLLSLAVAYAVSACLVGLYQWSGIWRWSRKQSLPSLVGAVGGLWSWQLSGFRGFLKVGFITGGLSGVVKNVDILVLGAWRSADEVGWYRIAKSLAGSLQSVSGALGQVVFQDFSEWVERGTMRDTRKFTRNATIRLTPLFSALYVGGGSILWMMIPHIYGVEFAQSQSLLIILLVGTWLSSILFWVSPMMLALEKLPAYVTLVVLNSALAMALYLILTPLYGAVGTAAALSSAWVFGHLFFFIYLNYFVTNESR